MRCGTKGVLPLAGNDPALRIPLLREFVEDRLALGTVSAGEIRAWRHGRFSFEGLLRRQPAHAAPNQRPPRGAQGRTP
ncbi:hypothetical protein [Embleya sp. NPDC005575]|uniref:hypothetical protein n=1 Tax=Embleya sp. NPDC005575 TaxID=3156892 RepID=UPI0033B6EAE4